MNEDNSEKITDLVEEVLGAITVATETLNEADYDIFIGILRDEI